MATKDDKVCIDLTCQKTSRIDVLNKDGAKETFTAVYRGTVEVGDRVVTIDAKFSADDEDVLAKTVPIKAGARRMMELGLTDEDLDNFN